MPNQRGRQPKRIQLMRGQDPALWRYASLTEALQACLPLLAEAILSEAKGQLSETGTTGELATDGAVQPAEPTDEEDLPASTLS